MSRPTMPDLATTTVYDWLGRNGVTEWLPEYPVVEVGVDTITYTAWVWPSDELRGFNPDFVVDSDGNPMVEWRAVPLAVWPSDDVATAAWLAGVALIDGTV